MIMHFPTLLVVLVITSATMTVAVGVAAKNSDHHDGLRQCALALAANTLIYLLNGLRGTVSDVITIFIPNLLLALVISLLTASLAEFLRLKIKPYLLFLPIVATVLVFTVFFDTPAWRSLSGILIYSFQSAFLLRMAIRSRRQIVGVGKYFMITACLLLFSIFLTRAVIMLFDTGISPAVVQSFSLLTSMVAIMLGALGLIVMTKERSDDTSRRLALQDELTGLPNRRLMFDTLNQHLAIARRARLPLTLLVLDVDYFKRVNDRYGHPAGDLVLQQVAHCLKSRIRSQDMAGRIGGEEFMVLLPQTDLPGGLILAESLRIAIEAESVRLPDGHEMQVTVSIGVSGGVVSDALQIEQLFSAADAALYQAKNNGRNRVKQTAVPV